MEWEKIFANHVSDQGSVSRIYTKKKKTSAGEDAETLDPRVRLAAMQRGISGMKNNMTAP